LGETVLSRVDAVAKCNKWRERQPEPWGPDFESWFCGDWYLDGEPSAGGLSPLPAYSIDIEEAFTAAERVGLFGDGICLLKHREGAWRIWDDDLGKAVASGSTPALVICKAILNLKEESDGRESSV